MLDVSIIISAYCTTKQSVDWLHECVQSAVDQDCEVVVYNDGSPMADVDDFVRIYPIHYDGQHKNLGVSQARNIAAYMATKSLIFPLDGDDTLKPGAIERLLQFWDGHTPVYTDIAKFGDINEPHFVLLDFSCENLKRHLGLSSVNVLHLRSQWAELGGWDANLEFYEDGEYNARLFGHFCAVRCPEPLVNYRMHSGQRTQRYKPNASIYANLIMSKIRRMDMPCASCGGKRNSQTAVQQTTVTTTTDPSTLPGSQDGRVLVQYVGSAGAGRHYYKGPVTKFNYRVTYGDYTYVDPKDITPGGLFVRVKEEPQPAAVPEPTQVQSVPEPPVIQVVEQQPVIRRQSVTDKPKNPLS